MLEAAAELFAADGYARTTLARIAAAAGVSAETVQGQGPKAALLIAAIEHAAFGISGEDDILNLEVGRALVAARDRDEAIDMLVRAHTRVHQRSARLAEALIGAAHADPELDRYRRNLIASVTLQQRRVLEAYHDRGWLRTDVPFDELVLGFAAVGSTETYLRLTACGWDVDTYQRWCRRMLSETVFAR
ncbi:TetR family transcriptional regulator [Mycolicibacterium arseniciresistens]|uniref:TetR family transcriptional regulator n=1 Tax=Mycolicibacterium arseniciresistens TaxID=3062257 RepID=A0ABT8UIV7_9MYCO|nr:TetR family transcriptional regulator [Mycolicibacterium arseniciresistens]MDO3636972.1 TetR family transcriptional regulator [Mycolicibacterium arseniciresistens]